MHLWRWLLVFLLAPIVFVATLMATGALGGIATGLIGVKAPLAMMGFGVVVGLVAVYKAGGMVLD